MRSGQRDRPPAIRRCATLLVLAVVLAGCSGHDAGPAPVPTKLATALNDKQFCRGGLPYSHTNPPYSGNGPHTAAVIVPGGRKTQVVAADAPILPKQWSPRYDARGTLNPRAPELLICMTLVQSATPMVIGKCDYQNPDGGAVTYDVIAAAYQFTVFVASTGRSLSTFRLGASGKADCPASVTAGSRIEFSGSLDAHQFTTRLRPFITRTA